jgi:hypothetical protein
MRGGDAAVDKVPLDFGFINQDGAFRSVGPVYALASYVNTLEPDPPLSHALRAAVQPLAGSAYGKIGGRLCSSPVRATFDQYRDHSGILPDEAAFLQHADRAVFPRGEKDAQPGLDDERAVLDHLWARVHRLSSGNAATEDHGRDGPAWLERVLDASVPVDLVRSVLLDADCLDMVRRLKPLPDASNPSKFFLQLKALADSLREKAAEEEVAQWLNVPQRPKPMSRIGEWQDWSSRLNWALIAAEGLGAQPLAVMRQRFPRIEPIVRTAFGVGNARDADLAVVMLRTGLWMAKDRVRFSITGNLRPADAGRLIAEVARELAEGLDHARSEFSRPVIAEGPPDATGSWDDSIADVASDFWENIFVPLLGAGSGDMPDGLERTISDYMQAGSQ